MRAILPGRPQSKRQAVSTAHWDGLRLVAYISGSTAIVLRSPHDIVQTIYIDHVESLSAITIEESSGRIAICNEERVLVFDALGREENDLRWTQTHDIPVPDGNTARTLSWGSSEELLVGGTELWLYHLPYSDQARLIWQQPVANEVHTAYFSNDAELIASCGKHDKLVKIWRRLSFELDSIRFDVSYLPHPAAVTDLHWRKPWHNEHSLDSLLYTFCSDNQIRVWTYSDPHSMSVVQLVATIDINASIEPRRRSIGSMSRRRYAFILDSRDFSMVTEKAILKSQNQKVDHALEHLIEIANRSPEICCIFDGLGHMSVWGLENAGCKTIKPTVVFNVVLVDQVDLQLSFEHNKHDDYTTFCVFGGGSDSASISVLVHSFTGQIDWYESPITHFFDTSSRKDRVKLVSSWSGHDLALDHLTRGFRGDRMLSWTDEGQAMLWSQSSTGALRRQSEIKARTNILSVVLLDVAGHVLFLYPDAICLWDVRHAHGVQIASVNLRSSIRGEPVYIERIESSSRNQSKAYFAINFSGGEQELWQVRLSNVERTSSSANGNLTHELITRMSQPQRPHTRSEIPCDVTSTLRMPEGHSSGTVRSYIGEDGHIESFITFVDTLSDTVIEQNISSFETNIENASLTRACSSGKCAVINEDKKCVTIWDLRQGTCEWRYVYKGSGEIRTLAWTSTRQGNLFLFVCSSYHASVVGQFRYPGVWIGQSAWYVTQNLSLRDFTTAQVGDVCWLSSGDLAVAAGNQIFVLDNTITEYGSPILRRSRHAVKNESAAAVLGMANSILPIFHADLLEALIMRSGSDPAETILRNLYEQLRYFSDGDELQSDLGLSIPELLSSTNKNATNGVVQVNGHTPIESFDLQNVESSFMEYLDNSEIWQIGPKKRQNIYNVFTNLIKVGKHKASLDENGLRYLYALYSTPTDQDLDWRAFVFASRSNSHEALVDLVMRQHDGKLTWADARRTGIFMWINDLTALQMQFENVARMEYTKQEDRSPVDCSLYYLALNKKSVLQSLWRRSFGLKEKENTLKLLSNDFEEPRWKATALKNAYALLSKHRFEYGAAFFLLGGSLKDAVNVCVKQLKDIQLAIAITRVWDRDTDQAQNNLHELLQTSILAQSIDSEQGRWMTAWAYSMMDQPAQALQAIVRPLHQATGTSLDIYDGPVKSMSFRANDPHLAILYTQIRQTLIKQNKWTSEVLSQREEWDFVIRNAKWCSRAGMDYLALKTLREWEFVPHQQPRQAVAPTTLTKVGEDIDAEVPEVTEEVEAKDKEKKKPPPTQFVEPSADSLLDSFGF